MSDQDLRALERRARATGHVDDAAAHLRARVRRGDLSPERLNLAAYAGDPAARAALGREAYWLAVRAVDHGDVSGEGDVLDLERWVRGLGRWGREVQQRAALAAARAAESRWRATLPGAEESSGWSASIAAGVARALALAERMLATPGQPGEDMGVVHDELPDFAYYAAMAVVGDQADQNPERRAMSAVVGAPYRQRQAAGQILGDRPVRDAIRSALTSWALGDPAREGAPS